MNNLRRDAKLVLSSIAATCVAFAIGLAWINFKPSLPSVLAPVSDDLAKVKQELLECQKLKVYVPKAKKKLNLPDTIKSDPTKHVLAASPIPPSDYPHTMTAVYDQGTGVVDMFLRRDPLPWLAFNRRWRFGGYYGINDRESGVVMGAASYEFLQLKRLHVTATGQVDTSSRWFIGVGATF